jgi:predicted NBD/HSP70 family sugar kinase
MIGAMQSIAEGRRLKAVVGGMPGELEGEDGKLILAPNLPHWVGLPVKARLKPVFDCPVYIHNDLVMGGVGEAHDGAGLRNGVMVYFTVSTGVNAVRLVDGRVDSSIKRYEIGFELLGQEHGKVSRLEDLIGGGAMELRLGKPPREVRDAAVWRKAERDLAHGLFNTLLHWTPDVVVFGGSMMRDIDLKRVRAELERLPAVLTKLPRLEPARLGDLGGLYGAMRWWELYAPAKRPNFLPKE